MENIVYSMQSFIVSIKCVYSDPILFEEVRYNRANSGPNFGASATHISLFKDPWVALPIARNLITSLYVL